MNVLAFDTSAEWLDIALSAGTSVVTSFRHIGLKHGEILILEAMDLCRKAGLRLSDIDLLVCARGPGSFTGLRIGMAAAKGIAFGAGIPLVSIPTLDAYAESAFLKLSAGNADSDGSGDREPAQLIVPALDARKGRFYVACYRGHRRVSDYLDLSAADIVGLLDSFGSPVILCGPDGELLKQAISGGSGQPASDFVGQPRTLPHESTAGVLAALGMKALQECGPDSEHTGPLYIRSGI